MPINKMPKTVALTNVLNKLSILGGVLGKLGTGVKELKLSSLRTKVRK